MPETKSFFSTIKRNYISDDTVAVLVHNVISLPRLVDILSDNRVINNDLIGFTETQIKKSDSTSKFQRLCLDGK